MVPAHRGAQQGDMEFGAEYPAPHARVTQMVYSDAMNKPQRQGKNMGSPSVQGFAMAIKAPAKHPQHPISP